MKDLGNINLRDRFIVSIVDGNGIKQFSVHRLIKKVALYAVLTIVISVVAIFFLLKLLATELEEIQTYRTETIKKYSTIYTQNQALQQQVDTTQTKLDAINEQMLDLEDIVSMRNSYGKISEQDKFDLLSLSSNQREILLRIIPSSAPFGASDELNPSRQDFYSYSAKDSPEWRLNSGIIFEVPELTPIVATADGIVDLVRSENTGEGIGRFVKVVHSFGFSSVYGHLSQLKVSRGNIVKKGQIIGYSIKGENSTAYYDVRFLGSEVNVERFINWNVDNFNIVMQEDSVINWNGLLWTFSDMMKINNYKLTIHHENTLSMR